VPGEGVKNWGGNGVLHSNQTRPHARLETHKRMGRVPVPMGVTGSIGRDYVVQATEADLGKKELPWKIHLEDIKRIRESQ